MDFAVHSLHISVRSREEIKGVLYAVSFNPVQLVKIGCSRSALNWICNAAIPPLIIAVRFVKMIARPPNAIGWDIRMSRAVDKR